LTDYGGEKQQHVAALLPFVLPAKSLTIKDVADVAGLDLFPGKVLAPFALCAFVLNIQVWICSPESGSEFVSFAYFVVDSVFPDLSGPISDSSLQHLAFLYYPVFRFLNSYFLNLNSLQNPALSLT